MALRFVRWNGQASGGGRRSGRVFLYPNDAARPAGSFRHRAVVGAWRGPCLVRRRPERFAYRCQGPGCVSGDASVFCDARKEKRQLGFRVLHAPLGDDAPYKEDDNGPNDGADEPGTLAGRIPPERLSEIARNDGSHDAEDRCQHETRGLVAGWHDEPRDYAGDKPKDTSPDDSHRLLL